MSTNYIGKSQKMHLYGNYINKGKGCYIFDNYNKKYIDMLSGAAVALFGYSDKEIVKIYSKAALQIQHTCYAYSPNPITEEYAQKLISFAPGNYRKKVIFGLTGSDSIDGAIKMAKSYTKKNKVISFKNGYHGSTGLAIKATNWKGISDISRNNYYLRFPSSNSEKIKVLHEIKCIKNACACIFEPIQGDAGVIIPQNGFINELISLCKKLDIVSIADEIQTGIGRTGKFWAVEHFDAWPDLIVAGKSLGGGYVPISAVIGNANIIDSLNKGQHIFSFSGHPPSCAVGMKIIDRLISEGIMKNVEKLGYYFIKKLREIKSNYIKEVRGVGLLIGVELNKDISKIIARRCFEKGVYFGIYGKNNEVLRISPPLTITKEIIDKVCLVLKDVFYELENDKIPQKAYDDANKCIGLGS